MHTGTRRYRVEECILYIFPSLIPPNGKSSLEVGVWFTQSLAWEAPKPSKQTLVDRGGGTKACPPHIRDELASVKSVGVGGGERDG